MADTSEADLGDHPGTRGQKRRRREMNIFVPALAALIGSAIGVAVTIVVTISQEHSQSSQAVTSYLRTERVTVYSEFLTDGNDFEEDVSDFDSNSIVSVQDENLFSDYYTIEIVGSPTTSNKAAAVITDTSKLDASYVSGLRTKSRDELRALTNDIAALGQSMRNDVQ
jgi:hypothetical protein